MFQIRIHGRGGQGVVTGAEMLSIAAFAQGRHAQAFPSFGSERTGAPVVAFCRIAEREMGTANRWKELRSANSEVLKGGSDLQPGMQIKIPEQRLTSASTDA